MISHASLQKQIGELKFFTTLFFIWSITMTILIVPIMRNQSIEVGLWEKQIQINNKVLPIEPTPTIKPKQSTKTLNGELILDLK